MRLSASSTSLYPRGALAHTHLSQKKRELGPPASLVRLTALLTLGSRLK
jgi:hypothetical protein